MKLKVGSVLYAGSDETLTVARITPSGRIGLSNGYLLEIWQKERLEKNGSTMIFPRKSRGYNLYTTESEEYKIICKRENDKIELKSKLTDVLEEFDLPPSEKIRTLEALQIEIRGY